MQLTVGEIGVDNFWILAVCSIGMYLAFFMVFLLFQLNAQKSAQPNLLVARTDFNFKKPNPINIFVVVMLALCCLTAFILVQFASLEFFYTIGMLKKPEPFVIGSWGAYFICVLAMCIMPAVVEELVFRGTILKSLLDNRKKGSSDIAPILISSLLFALFHLNPAQLVYQFILGLVCALIYLKTRNLGYAILAHFINNFFIVTYTFIAGSDYMPFSWNAYTIVTAILLAILGSAVIMGLIRLLKKEKHAGQ